MTENAYNRVVDALHERRFKVREKLREQFGKVPPFRAEELTEDEELYYYNQLRPEDMRLLIQKHGEDTVSEMIQRMEVKRNA